MIERQSIVDQIEITRNGTLAVRLALLLVDDGKELASKFHRTSIPLECPPMAQMLLVNEHLVQMGEAPLSAVDVQRIVDYHTLTLGHFAALA